MKQPDTNSVWIWDEARGVGLLFERPVTVIQAQRPDEVIPALRAIERHVDAGRFAAGWLAYEAAPAFDPALTVHGATSFPLLWFGIYENMTTGGAERFPPRKAREGPSHWEASITDEAYREAIHAVRTYIEQGDTYQVNFTYRLSARLDGPAWPLFARLLHPKDARHGAYINAGEYEVYSASPELFFRLEGTRLESRPMKGTAARGMTLEADRAQAEWLRQSEKNRAENVMIVDMMRNDMGRIAVPGSVAVDGLFDVEKYSTLWQMTSTVSCRAEASVTDILRALFPAASITGAPKCRTMQIIRELEDTPRNIYTGSIGCIAPGRRALFNIAIRTLLVDHAAARLAYGVGGGIVWDSEDAAEQEECRTKAKILLEAPPDFCLLETLLWTAEADYFLEDEHMARLKKSAAYFSFPMDDMEARAHLSALSATFGDGIARRVRLLVDAEGAIRSEAFPITIDPAPEGQRIVLDTRPVPSNDPFLYHKTTCRRVYEEARQRFPGYDDVLLQNERGELTESSVANIVVELDGTWYTPPVECGLLAGTLRADMLARGILSERVITRNDLRKASHIYLINAVRKMQCVASVHEGLSTCPQALWPSSSSHRA
ncbi:MAG: aminodeoxychorismate synthase component I [Spartobacteria bacterium]|nr:aminodeoxychorismate synthase component I [Spartobacteria bacterium]